jgi:hypothetical protein
MSWIYNLNMFSWEFYLFSFCQRKKAFFLMPDCKVFQIERKTTFFPAYFNVHILLDAIFKKGHILNLKLHTLNVINKEKFIQVFSKKMVQ